LAIDPSSNISGGSILGDKTRMEKLAQQPHAFIRPSAAGKTLGGVAKATGEAILLCEAAGFDIIIVETVGVGQSETAVKNITDFFLLLMLAGAGDELQGMKRGIMEMADAIVINKADGDNLHKAKEAAQQYKQALHLFPPHENGWVVPVETASALTGFQIEKTWHILEQYNTTQAQYILQKRQQQQVAAFKELLQHQVLQHLFSMPEFANKIAQAENNIAQQTSYAYKEAQYILAFVKEHLA
jgi:LAO/AO transport system kinase